MLINLISIALYTSWPAYIAIFLHCARHNPAVRFTVVSNLNEHHPSWGVSLDNVTKPDNVAFVYHTLDSIVSAITKDNLGLVGMNLTVNSPYKLIDFKPMYGVLFADELTGFSHWGWFDMDIFLGDIKSTYECGYLGEDFLSYDHVPFHGPLTIMRNHALVNNFYLNMLSRPDMMNTFTKHHAILFDEIHMPRLVEGNESVTLKRIEGRNCDTFIHRNSITDNDGIWMWYKGEMHHSSNGTSGPCVMFHYGGGGKKNSNKRKGRQWSRASRFFRGYHGSDHGSGPDASYGFGEMEKSKVGPISLVFKFTGSDNEFTVVDIILPSKSAVAAQRYIVNKYIHRFRLLAARFHLPGKTGQCPA